ncbi:MAG: cytochrome c [Deinococcales bacterium]|nr:cytochrome c [Deinococcales bacterium]
MPDRSQYLFSPRQVRMAVALGTVAMIAAIVVLLLLATARPQGRYQALDGTQFQQHLIDSTAALSGYEVDGDRARIDIFRAMELVAERGVVNPGFYTAGAAPAAPAQAGAAGDTGTTGADAEGGATAALPDGEALYVSTCAACHQSSGQGLPGAFPPLAGHAPALYEADRALPLAIITFGMQGPIDVDGMVYNGLMPAHAHLGDADIAAIANHVMTAWGNDAALPGFEPYAASDVAAVRGEALSFTQVHDLRTAAGLE